MPVIKRKTRKAIAKQVKKLVNKHGAEVALGLATDFVGSVVETVTGKAQAKSKKKDKKGDSGKKKNKTPKLLKSDGAKTDVTPKSGKKQAAKKTQKTSEAQS
ncbi:MAG TPA: hypothetical protein VGO96_07010 [Pyrinomonadaceae bacterium]|nr:hypothetical protein [Pyrinomonadaceae bacterium]